MRHKNAAWSVQIPLDPILDLQVRHVRSVIDRYLLEAFNTAIHIHGSIALTKLEVKIFVCSLDRITYDLFDLLNSPASKSHRTFCFGVFRNHIGGKSALHFANIDRAVSIFFTRWQSTFALWNISKSIHHH